MWLKNIPLLSSVRSIGISERAVKSVMYTAGRVIRAKKFICLDADMLVLDELRSLSSAIDSVHPADILACREAKWAENLGIAIKSIYGGNDADLRQLTCSDGDQESRIHW